MTEKAIWGKKVFSIDDTLSAEGYSRGVYWNGWDCPAFERIEAEYILNKLCRGTKNVSPLSWCEYDEEKDVMRFVDGYNIEETMTDEEKREWIEEWEGFNIETKDGIKHVYAIGAYSWIWFSDEEME